MKDKLIERIHELTDLINSANRSYFALESDSDKNGMRYQMKSTMRYTAN